MHYKRSFAPLTPRWTFPFQEQTPSPSFEPSTFHLVHEHEPGTDIISDDTTSPMEHAEPCGNDEGHLDRATPENFRHLLRRSTLLSDIRHVTNSKNDGIHEHSRIPKPKGGLSKPAQGGYQLRERLNWDPDTYRKVQDMVHTMCEQYFDLKRSWADQVPAVQDQFRHAVVGWLFSAKLYKPADKDKDRWLTMKVYIPFRERVPLSFPSHYSPTSLFELLYRMVARYDPDNLLNLSVQLLTTHLLFVTNKATLTERWANTSVVVSEPTQASVILVAPERRGHHRRVAWLLLKSASATLVRSLNYTQEENLTGLSPIFADEEQSALMLRIGQRTHRLMFENSGLFYCFLLKSKPSLTDLYYPRVLSEDSLLQAWETYHIISDFPRMLQGQPVQLDEEQTGLSTVAHPQFDTLSDAATNPTIAVMLNEEEAGLATG
ncbi:hypothetical protein BU15DRAFT_69410, partial [Melanogaster broomeanus]